MGAHVIVLEVDPMRALQAVMDGHRVMPVADAARRGDIFVTVTGDKHVLRAEHFEVMRDGAIIANAGHFNVEVDVPALEALAVERTLPRPEIELFRLADGRQIALIAEGRLVNLGAAEGHPASVMDMTFANQALSVEYAVLHGGGLERRVYVVPDEIDTEIARLKLRTLGLAIDQLTVEQERYLATWDEGT
jgi:adenosylhomocysteinase